MPCSSNILHQNGQEEGRYTCGEQQLRPRQFRPPGSPAGTWVHIHWTHSVFHDPYERVNVWSHGIPAAIFFFVGVFVLITGKLRLGFFCFCAATTQGLSAITHVYPDHHGLEKLDHVGILAILLGTPLSILWGATEPVDLYWMWRILPLLALVAFCPPMARTLGFGAGCLSIFLAYWKHLFSVSIGFQLALYSLGAFFFLRNGGHDRQYGWADHHILHYSVTLACCLQFVHLACTIS